MPIQLKILKRGDRGPLVGVWQEFLKSYGEYDLAVDNDFGKGTQKGTRGLERRLGLPMDGVVDDTLWGYALSQGLCLAGSRWDVPDKPSFRPLGAAGRTKIFGEIKYKPRGKKGAIYITNNWRKNNLVRIEIPQLKTLYEKYKFQSAPNGFPKSGKISWHKKGVDNIQEFFRYVETEGLLFHILSWAGSWAPRYIRNRPGILSSHAWATAFDINVAWNGMGRTPAPGDSRGSVHELVPIAHECGFYWGGHFKRPDGMHFELAQLSAVWGI
jgi:peptidoglycan hydrolase-like protein with peptidoglycan-binding domain